MLVVISIIPEYIPHLEVSWVKMICIQWLRMRKYYWTDLTKLCVASLTSESNFTITEYERDVKKKGIRILCYIICIHRFDTMYYGEKFCIYLCLNFLVDFI